MAQQQAIVAGGCFWCTEAVYLAIAGVKSVVSGYAGGTAATANYDAVCSGATDHAVLPIEGDVAAARRLEARGQPRIAQPRRGASARRARHVDLHLEALVDSPRRVGRGIFTRAPLLRIARGDVAAAQPRPIDRAQAEL